MGKLLSVTAPGIDVGGTFCSAYSGCTLVLNETGIVTAINDARRERVGPFVHTVDVGTDYLALCRRESRAGTRAAAETLAGVESVLGGKCPAFTFVSADLSLKAPRWFQVLAVPIPGEAAGVSVTHLDVTEHYFRNTEARETASRFHGVFEASKLACAIFDSSGAVLDINESYLELTGKESRTAIVGRHALDWISAADRNRLQEAITACATTGNAHRIEAEYCSAAADGLTVGMNLVRVMAHDGAIVAAFCFDLTEQKRAATFRRQAVQEDDRYRSVVETQTELVCRYLPDTTLTFVNEAYCRFFKMKREELVGRSFLDFVPVNAREGALRAIARTVSGKQPLIYEHEVTAPGGQTHWQEWVDIPIYDNFGRIVELQGIGRDITQQHQAEEELKLSHRHVHDLASRLMRAQEIERRSIARELHDDLSQRLAAHAIALSNLKRRMPELPEALAQRMAMLESEAMSLGDSVRHMSHQLHPAVLEQLGLAAALRSFCTEAGERSRLEFHVDAKDPDHVMSDQVGLALYRVAQETIRNIERHARAKNVWVRLTFSAQDAVMEIRDDGVGFDSSGSKKSTGLGLISVEERIRFLNGRLILESRPGSGTSIHVFIPQPKL